MIKLSQKGVSIYIKDNKKNIIIIILSLLLLAALGYIIYSKLNNNTNQNTNNTKEQNNLKNIELQEYNVVGDAYNGINIIKNTNDDIDTKNGDPV